MKLIDYYTLNNTRSIRVYTLTLFNNNQATISNFETYLETKLNIRKHNIQNIFIHAFGNSIQTKFNPRYPEVQAVI